MADQRLVFVSYSHKDNDQDNLVLRVLTHLRGLRPAVPGLDIWVDATNIRAGDTWAVEIDAALAGAALGVLLISPDFLDSTFIMEQELPRLWKRHDETGLRIVPIQLRPCTAPSQLGSLEMRPRGEVALSVISEQGRASLDRVLQKITEEIIAVLGPAAASPSGRVVSPQARTGGDVEEARCIALLTKTLFGNGSSEFYVALAFKLMREIRRCANVSGDALFDAVRFFIEFQLLTSDDPTSPAALEASLGIGVPEAEQGPLVGQLRQIGRTGQFSTATTTVASRFFGLTTTHSDLWKNYFDAVIAAGASTQAGVGSLVSIKATVGYLSAQFLVAGLLSRLDDDWRPVLNVYSRSTHVQQAQGAFESLQASQWNCWLMWGPSIPLCRCPQWSGLSALQYGYGDENNSLPVVDLSATDGIGPALGPVVSALAGERRAAKFGALTVRLRWGPYLLRSEYSGPDLPDAEEDPQIGDRDAEVLDRDALAPPGRRGAAPAQASIYAEQGLAHRQARDGLVLELQRLDHASPHSRVYFSAYLWVMFLVATGPGTDVGPHLLSGKPCPGWSDDDGIRKQHVMDGRFWQDLLPVFVHANIGDPKALAFQKGMLVENAAQLLRQVWNRRQELFPPETLAKGLRFYLVCASDHSGCGHEPRFPADDSLVELLRARFAAEADRELADHVIVPGTASGHGLDGLESYFSACHLPELIGWYYDHVFELNKSRPRAR